MWRHISIGGFFFSNLTVECLSSDREIIWREQNGHDPAVPKDADELKRFAQPAQTPSRLGERFGRQEDPAEADEAVRSGRGHTRCGDERRECHRRGEDGARHDRGDGPYDDDGVARLSLGGDA